MQRQLNHVQVLLDALVLGLSYTLAWYFAIWNPIFPEGHGVLSPRFYFSVLIPLIPAYLFLYWLLGLYRPMRTMRIREAFFRILQSNSIDFCSPPPSFLLSVKVVILSIILQECSFSFIFYRFVLRQWNATCFVRFFLL